MDFKCIYCDIQHLLEKKMFIIPSLKEHFLIDLNLTNVFENCWVSFTGCLNTLLGLIICNLVKRCKKNLIYKILDESINVFAWKIFTEIYDSIGTLFLS